MSADYFKFDCGHVRYYEEPLIWDKVNDFWTDGEPWQTLVTYKRVSGLCPRCSRAAEEAKKKEQANASNDAGKTGGSSTIQNKCKGDEGKGKGKAAEMIFPGDLNPSHSMR